MGQSYNNDKMLKIFDAIYKNFERMSKNHEKKVNKGNSNKRKK